MVIGYSRQSESQTNLLRESERLVYKLHEAQILLYKLYKKVEVQKYAVGEFTFDLSESNTSYFYLLTPVLASPENMILAIQKLKPLMF